MNNKIYNRVIINNIKKWLERPEIIVITGARQTGKTFLAKKILPNITKKKIKYFNFEDFELIELFKKSPKDFINNILNKEYIYIFDEFQKLPEFSGFLKVLYDKNKTDFPKIFLTGSSSLEIQKNVSESLAGQSIVFNIFSLSFLEKYDFEEIDFLTNILNDKQNFDVNALKKKIFFNENKIKRKFNQYILDGGYPELGEFKDDLKWEKLKSIIKAIMEKDLQSLIKNEHLYLSKKLLEIIAFRIGNLISFENLASEMQINIKTVRRIVAILEGLFFINLIYPKANFANEYKKAPKIYFCDQGIRNEIIKMHDLPLDSFTIGGLVENFVFGQLRRYIAYKKDYKINFWQDYNKNEVDFILSHGKNIISIEVKYRRGQRNKITAGIRNFIKKYNPQFHITATYDYFGTEETENTKIYFVPVYVFGLLI